MKVKEKHLKIRQTDITESEFVYAQVKESFKDSFKSISEKHGIKLKEFTNKLQETFNVNDYKGKDEDKFIEVLIEKVVKPVFEDNNIRLV